MNKPEKPILEMFEVKVEATIPCQFIYRIMAENANDAISKIDKQQPSSFKPHLNKKKKIKATAYTPGTIVIKATKTF